MIKSAGLIGGLGVIPAVSSADDSSQEFEIESLEREELASADSYTVYRYRVNSETLYLKVLTDEKVIQTLSPNEVSTQETEDVSTLVRADGWSDKVLQFKRDRGTVLKQCSAVDGYGSHRYRLASVEFTSPAASLSGSTLTAILNAILEPLGIPGLKEVISAIVGGLVGLATYNVTVGAQDSDLPFDTAAITPKFSSNYGDGIGDLRGLVPLPVGHID